jgi:hypothetical protein
MRWLTLFALALLSLVIAYPSPAAAEDDVVHVFSRVSYDARPDQGPVRVAWDVSFKNNDPQTSPPGSSGEVFFYENVTVPMLRGATAIAAVSSSGVPLDVALTEEGSGPTVSATISFDDHVFLGQSYDFRLTYELSEVRVPSLLVTPTYVYLPLVAGGDRAEVTVNYPSGRDWNVSLEEAECGKEGAGFACSGQDSGFLAALLEISRPDAISSIPFEVPLEERVVSVRLRYFIGEEAAANRLRQLATAALPIIEKEYGFPYRGQDRVTISQGGRQTILGYEGLTSCDPEGECVVTVSPAADDLTFVHELAHLWSGAYGRRWMSEGFAQIIAEKAAAALPPDLVRTRPAPREPSSSEIALDNWGSVSSLIGADEAERDRENAGYDRSVQFLNELSEVVGTDALQQANAALAATDSPASSERFLDTLEDVSGKRLDGLFAERVFPKSYEQTLWFRRQVRDRLATLYQAAADRRLSTKVPDEVRPTVDGWQFMAAFDALDEADRKLGEHDVLKRALELLGQRAEAEGLKPPPRIDDRLHDWDFVGVRLGTREAARAIDAYRDASANIDSSRSVWEQFGLVGKSPRAELEEAAAAFANGDFDESTELSAEARSTVDNASDSAFRRLLLLGLIGFLIAGAIWSVVWFAGRYEQELAEI